EVAPAQEQSTPGHKATGKIKLNDFDGKPFTGSTVLTLYDKSVEYISGGSNVPEIREFFWKWRRHHYPQTESSQNRWFYNLLRPGEFGMANLGVFGETVVEELHSRDGATKTALRGDAGDQFGMRNRREGAAWGAGPAAPMAALPGPGGGGGFGFAPGDANMAMDKAAEPTSQPGGAPPQQQPGQTPGPGIRKNFADTA